MLSSHEFKAGLRDGGDEACAKQETIGINSGHDAPFWRGLAWFTGLFSRRRFSPQSGVIYSSPFLSSLISTKENKIRENQAFDRRTNIMNCKIIAALLLLASDSHLRAQILDIYHFKGTVYIQTSPSPAVTPRYPDVYYFANLLDADPAKALEYSPFMVFTPSTSPTNGEFVMTETSTYSFSFNSPYYACKTNFDADYPNGLYNYVTTYSDPNNNNPKSDNVLVQTPANDLYSTNLPAFSPDCWTAMQNVDPAADFNLSWNNYTQMTGSDYAYTFVSAYDSQTVEFKFNFNGPSDVTSTTIPAGSLDYGRTYIVELFFSNRVTPDTTNEDGSFVSVTVGFDDITDATLVTIPPPLQISQAGGCVTLTWPSMATNYMLQTIHQLGGSDYWHDVTNSPTVVGSVNSLNLPAKHTQAFFRLTPL
jgi:hypothetical protein